MSFDVVIVKWFQEWLNSNAPALQQRLATLTARRKKQNGETERKS